MALSCDGQPTSTDPSERVVAAYIFLEQNRVKADEFVGAVTLCDSTGRCSPAGFVEGLQSASVVPDEDGGWGLALQFDRSAADEVLDRLEAALQDRAGRLDLGEVDFLFGNDVWPWCNDEPDCLTVDESSSG
jgi:hypothetical protein